MSARSRRCPRKAVDRCLSQAMAGLLDESGVAGEPVDAVGAGRALLGAAGIAVVGFAPLLAPDRRVWWTLLVISAGMLAALVLSLRIDWAAQPAWATLAFPLAVCAGLASLGVVSSSFAAPLTGVLTLCFAYLGITQPPGTALFALPVAATTVLCTYGGPSGPVIVRLLIAVFVWTLLAELLARLMRHQRALTTSWAGAAHRDDLTGLNNRRDLHQRLAAAAPGDTIVMLDLDHFKVVNDTFGHTFGDRVLAEFGVMLRVTLRDGDYTARYGGEEFLLLLPATTATQAHTLLQRLQHHWATLQPAITFSAGIATCQPDRTPQTTLTAADTMLYTAKTTGRNRTLIEPTHHKSTRSDRINHHKTSA